MDISLAVMNDTELPNKIPDRFLGMTMEFCATDDALEDRQDISGNEKNL